MIQRKQRPIWLALTAVLLFALSGVAAAAKESKPLQLSSMSGGNPALIGQQGFLRLFVGGDVDVGNNVLQSVDLVKLFETADLDQGVLDLMPPEGIRVWVDGENGIEVGVGPVEIRSSVHLTGAMQVTPDLLDLNVNEPQVGDTYTADGTELTVGGYGTITAGGSLGLPSIANSLGWDEFRVGARVHALSGVAYARAELSGSIAIEQDQVTGVLVGELWDHPAETKLWTAGQGFAFDVGVHGQLSERWSIGITVANVGRLTWNDVHYQRFESDIDWDAVSGEFELDWNQVADETLSIVWHLPRRIEGAVGFRASDTLFVSAGVAQTTYYDHDGRASDGRTDLNAHVVWEGIPFLPLSAGVTYSGSSGWALTTGTALNLGPLRLTAQVDSIPLPNFGREVGFAFGAGLAF